MLQRSVMNAIIDFIEAYHTTYGKFPRRADVMTSADIAAKPHKVTPKELDEFFEFEGTVKSLEARGIIAPWSLSNSPTGLTKDQLAVAASLNSIKDRRSDDKKLRDLDVTHRQFTGWMHNKTFANYMKASSNNLVENYEHEAHTGLLRSLANGNVQAMKLYYEMTGRYNPAYENGVNVQQLMTRLIEIIQQEVQDPDTLSRIAAKFQMANTELGASPVGAPNQIVQGVTTKEIESNEENYNKPVGALYF